MGESTCDVIMSDDDKNEDSHQEAWTVFERMFSHLYHLRWLFLLLECCDSTGDYTTDTKLGLLTSTYAVI